MWRALVFVGLLALAAYGAVWLADRPGDVLITYGAYRIQTTVAVALVLTVGTGDPIAARRAANEAERFLVRDPLTLLLKAQAAQVSGNRDAAEAAFQRMVD